MSLENRNNVYIVQAFMQESRPAAFDSVTADSVTAELGKSRTRERRNVNRGWTGIFSQTERSVAEGEMRENAR